MSIKSFSTITERALFEPQTPTYLGVCRFIVFGWLFFWYLFTGFGFIAEYPSAMWEPIPILEALGLTAQPSSVVVAGLKALWLMSLFFACIGLFTRTSIGFALVIGFYLLAATHSFYKINHSDAGLLLMMLVLMFSRCGDGFAIDALYRVAKTGPAPLMVSGEYHWPVQMVRLVWVIVFFLAGVAKVRRGGMDWMFSDSMANLVLRKQIIWEPPTALGWYFLKFPWTCQMMAIGAVMIELAAPLVLFSKIARLLIVPAMLGMQIGILLIMGDDFTQLMSIYMFFVPWLLVGSVVLSLKSIKSIGQIEVLYDGKCGLCGRTVAVLQRVDLLDKLRFRDVVSDWQQIQADHPEITRDRSLEDMHVIDATGSVTWGFDGYRRMAWVVPLGWLLLPVLYFPGVSIVGRKIYRRIADQRAAGGQCAI